MEQMRNTRVDKAGHYSAGLCIVSILAMAVPVSAKLSTGPPTKTAKLERRAKTTVSYRFSVGPAAVDVNSTGKVKLSIADEAGRVVAAYPEPSRSPSLRFNAIDGVVYTATIENRTRDTITYSIKAE
jgi:hypothetical protein